MELSNRRIVEWWDGGMTEYVELSNRRIVKPTQLMHGEMMKLVKLSNRRMVKW